MEAKKLSMDVIQPYWRNPRKNAGAVDAVARSIIDYGYNVPIVVDLQYVIIAGDTRYRALKKLGVKEIDVMVVDLDEEKARGYRIADNKAAEVAEWNFERLIDELKGLDGTGFAFDAFFHPKDLESLGIALPPGAANIEVISSFNPSAAGPAIGDMGLAGPVRPERPADTGIVKPTAEVICPNCGEEYQFGADELEELVQ